MFLRQFEYLIALEKEGHFGRAAERCHVSQPSLSSALQQLEAEAMFRSFSGTNGIRDSRQRASAWLAGRRDFWPTKKA